MCVYPPSAIWRLPPLPPPILPDWLVGDHENDKPEITEITTRKSQKREPGNHENDKQEITEITEMGTWKTLEDSKFADL